jgi:hypothetical protein
LFDGPSSPNKFLEKFLVAEHLMFLQHSVTFEECAYPLLGRTKRCHTWHNVAWLARQILAIPGSQIEIK